MTHFGDYMDGVPVKISEKYKRPPRVELPYSVVDAPIRAQGVLDNIHHSSTFEKNVLVKLKELRSIKETKKNERRHRLQLIEEEKQKKLDAIAVAEEEDRLKQLSVSEVSYPSTDEISALSDEKNEKNSNNEVVTEVILPSSSTATESQVNILQPIQVKSNYGRSLLDDPDPLQTLKLSSKVNKIQYDHNVDTLTFRDFENDTSSPFDNVELKTINDMELLAQVLQSQRESATSCPQYIQNQNYPMNSCGSQVQLEIPYIPNTYVEQPIQGPSLMYSPQNYPNGYYIQEENVNVYVPNYQYYVPPNPYAVDPNYYNQIPLPSEVAQVPNGSYVPQPYYPQYIQSYEPPNTYVQKETEPQVSETQVPESQNTQSTPEQTPNTQTVKSRSRSVPDIVKELNDELEKLKMSERSYNVSPAPKAVPQPLASEQKKAEKKRRRSEHLPNPYDQLYPKLQSICQKIHGMGFPLDRVARVCTIIGENEKKAIECLLLIGEMMDLGFSEARVSAALAKHKFDRDKALDELVS